MKKLIFAAFVLLLATTAFAQTDVRDSIILESKSVATGERGAADTSAYLYVKVYITNKDSLKFMVLSLKEVSTYNGAYAILGRPRTFAGIINALTPSFLYGTGVNVSKYDGVSPDSFLVGGGFDGVDPNTMEPPNDVRKAVWEIKFDSVLNYSAYAGTFELDSAVVAGQPGCYFTDTWPVDIPVNFVKSIITVAPQGDMNGDGQLTGADIIWTLWCVFNEMEPPAGVAACDHNCDGRLSAADLVWEIEAAINGRSFPC